VRIGVFGGSFDPPHNGHLALCLLAREQLGLDRILISVSKNPFKSSADAPDSHRKKMTELLASEVNATGDFVTVSDWELGRPGPSYTIDFLRHLRQECGNPELLLLVGEDSYRDMPGWKSSDEIPGLCSIVVFTRPTAFSRNDTEAGILPPARFVDFDLPVSATEVRELMKNGRSATHLLPPSIAGYIEANGLYR
jgi:nicotinate-nucleotide adenylyltransferase